MSRNVRFVSLALIGAATAAIGCGGGSSSSTPSTASSNGCTRVAAAKPHPERTKLSKPAASLPEGSVWDVTLVTNCGSITFRVDSSKAPKTASAFVGLAQSGFYDGLSFHRIAPGFVIQGGDPLGTGLGGPGFTTVERPPVDQTYPRGTVAMAKSPDQPAGAAGSQFFIVTGEDAALTPDYAVVGTVSKGLDVSDRISAVGVDQQSGATTADGPPAQPVVIERVVVTRVS